MYNIFWPIFWLTLLIMVVVMIIAYAKTTKLHPLMYILTAFSYVNVVTYAIDVYTLNRNWIILLLALSSTLMIWFGKHVGKKIPKKNKKNYKIGVIIPLSILIVVAIIGIFEVGVSKELNFVEQISEDELYVNCSKVHYNDRDIVIGNVTVSNNFILPRNANQNFLSCIDGTYGIQEVSILEGDLRVEKGEVFPFETKSFNIALRNECNYPESKQEKGNTLYLLETEKESWQVGCEEIKNNKNVVKININ